MAKRKNAAALFEVIHADNRYAPRAKSSGGWSFSAPSWMKRRRRSDAESSAATIVDAPAIPSGPSIISRAFAMIPSVPRIGLSVDQDQQLVRFDLSYTGALVSAFTLCVAITLAYVIGRHSIHPAHPALAEQTTEELRAGPAQADVLDIHGDGAPVAMAVESAPAPAPTRTATPAPANSSSAQGVRPSWTEPRPPATLVVSDSKRQVGLQYVIVQSYPAEEKQWAESAVKMLNENGVLCTIEKGVPYAPSSFCVVGVSGFDRTKNSPEYDAYVARIKEISDKFAGTVRFKRFDPKPFKWREAKGEAVKQ